MELISVKPPEEQLPEYATDLPAGTYLTGPGGLGLFVVASTGAGGRAVISLDTGRVADSGAMRHFKVIPPGSEVTFRV